MIDDKGLRELAQKHEGVLVKSPAMIQILDERAKLIGLLKVARRGSETDKYDGSKPDWQDEFAAAVGRCSDIGIEE